MSPQPNHTGFSGATIKITKDPEQLVLWRAAVRVWRQIHNDPTHPQRYRYDTIAATGAVMALRPGWTWDEANVLVNEAVASCSTQHTDWLYGNGGEEPEWASEKPPEGVDKP